MKSPESCIRFLLKLKCTVWEQWWWVSPGQSWFCISVCLCSRCTQEPETWAIDSEAGSTWEGRHQHISTLVCTCFACQGGSGRGALEVLFSPEILRHPDNQGSSRAAFLPFTSGPDDSVSLFPWLSQMCCIKTFLVHVLLVKYEKPAASTETEDKMNKSNETELIWLLGERETYLFQWRPML